MELFGLALRPFPKLSSSSPKIATQSLGQIVPEERMVSVFFQAATETNYGRKVKMGTEGKVRKVVRKSKSEREREREKVREREREKWRE